jgi:hypothetical protein
VCEVPDEVEHTITPDGVVAVLGYYTTLCGAAKAYVLVEDVED